MSLQNILMDYLKIYVFKSNRKFIFGIIIAQVPKKTHQ